jgi:hypothetical protein
MAVSDGCGPSMGLSTIAGGGGDGDGCGEARPSSLSLSLQSTPTSSPPGPDLLSSVARAWWRMRRWWRRHRSGQRGPGSGGRGPRSLFPVPVASSSLFLSLSISLFLAHYFFPLFRQWKARHNVSRPSLSPTGPPSHPPLCPGPWPIPPLRDDGLRQWSSLLVE